MSATGQLLLSDHQRLDELFARLLDDVHCGDWTVCQATWSRFERELLQPLEAEETFLLPMFEREYPEETTVLRADHTSIRRLLADLGIQVELHALREQNARYFVESLRGHAAREELLLYRWANDLPPEIADALAQRREAPSPKALTAIETPRA
jgi:hypothetical protein